MTEIVLHPTGDAICNYFLSAGIEQGFVTATNPARLRAFRDLIPDQEFGEWTVLVEAALSLSGIYGHRVAPRNEVEAAIEWASHLEHCPWPPLPGIQRVLRSTLDELHRYLIPIPELVRKEPEERLLRLLQLWQRTSQVLDQGHAEFLTDRIELLLTLPPVCVGHLGPIYVLPTLEPDPRAEAFFAWLSSGGTDIRILRTSACAHWTSALFTEEAHLCPVELREIRAAGLYPECEWAIRAVAEALAGGAAPHNVAICVPQSQIYTALLNHMAEVHGIPLHRVERLTLSEVPFVAFTSELLRFMIQAGTRDLLRLANWSYWGFDSSQLLEIKEWVHGELANGRKALTELDNAPLSEVLTKWLTSLLQWRVHAQSAVMNIRSWCQSVQTLLQETGLLETLASDALPIHERDARTHTAMFRILLAKATVWDRTNRTELTLAEFLLFAERTWAAGDVIVQGGRDRGGVALLESVENAISYDHVIVVGARERSIPAQQSADPVLSDEERTWINEHSGRPHKLMLTADRERAEREKFTHLCAAARKSLTFLYPAVIDQSPQSRSFFLDELERATGQALAQQAPGVRDFAPALERCLTAADQRLAAAMARPPVELVQETVHDPANLTAVQAKAGSTVPLGAVVAATDCPFLAVMRHILNVSPPRLPSDSLVHSAYDFRFRIGDRAIAEHFREFLDDRLNRIAPYTELWRIPLLESRTHQLVHRWTGVFESLQETVQFEPLERSNYNAETGEIKKTIPAAGSGGALDVSFRVADVGLVSADRGQKTLVAITFPQAENRPERGVESVFLLAALGSQRAAIVRTVRPKPAVIHGRDAAKIPGLRRTSLGEDSWRSHTEEDLEQDTIRKLRDGVTQLLTHRMEARWNPGCKKCNFRDLCRQTQEGRPIAF